ncbi:MAG TPA: glycerophosphodiester phosphodiesterase [Longimicrobium sp.]|nr:glycerophosphodiester phosphodiesterase [Longimicrobium sp.]
MAQETRPLVIAHRGASGWLPEHTLEAYRAAVEAGADFIEPDLVATRDGVLVARHENRIDETTDVAARPEFAGRRRTKEIDGQAVTGWFTEDFTLAELKTLRARERLPHLRPRSAAHDGRYEVPTLDEVIALALRASEERGRAVGIYPETKHPSYFRALGLPLEEALVDALHRAGWREREDPVFIQSFETANLRDLRGKTRLRLVQLMEAEGRPFDWTLRGETRTYADMATPDGLREVAGYAGAIGPAKALVIPRGPDERLGHPTRLVDDAHAAGLQVHPWTFRSENAFLPADLRRGAAPHEHGDSAAEYARFFAAGVDGVFSDFAAEAVAARAKLGER